MRVKYPHWCFIFLYTFAKKTKKQKKNNEIEANFRTPGHSLFSSLITGASFIFLTHPLNCYSKGLKLVARSFAIASCMKCCWQSVSQAMVQCLYSCDVLRTNWKYKWPNIWFTFSPAIIGLRPEFFRFFLLLPNVALMNARVLHLNEKTGATTIHLPFGG